ncbi:uncharacterized protein LOC111684862 [Lucilia cuprina]|uniref:uncharacterized protein LOC111684862 n=1 Tax=Lucilia cuprina TaxID=7375 RepID=UPI001F05E788|nr:uncharacterized protein LOC111684862 [Lucilia cuprina]XP_046811458.1 uncharacterized protein LOC111684862 [Lucilia cuprina]XP_046811459.1 uncharacterized protein LOC111684862 [Lucilia cuprina]XP_046811460.1 uncharacterized protein LOC111684862 [Lucilia cuprina]XP_046811461.1 uncharacterized protein LOC111684862 [Lucilia cuprina]XP_046811462.1 uncharacterized protein LOC111684862 [Lucilia cuprina]XP_046811463.1 uncharacterized protein LOC111684862 [Lucilia cuprina]XP_046811464.1 uncharacte
MYGNFVIFILNILIMSYSQALDQIELTQTLTESPTLAPSDNDSSIFITCDFDLENIESLLQYLPEICTEIYNNRSSSYLYDLYLEESQNFAKFYKKLNDYELRDQPQGDKQELSKYPFETKLRNDTYSKADWSQCVTTANSSASDYLKCLKEKRLELAELIPNVEKNMN